MKFLRAALLLSCLPAASFAQQYPSPVFQGVTVLGAPSGALLTNAGGVVSATSTIGSGSVVRESSSPSFQGLTVVGAPSGALLTNADGVVSATATTGSGSVVRESASPSFQGLTVVGAPSGALLTDAGGVVSATTTVGSGSVVREGASPSFQALTVVGAPSGALVTDVNGAVSAAPTIGSGNILRQSVPYTPGNVFYSNFGSPQPTTLGLGDKVRIAGAVGLPETNTVSFGTWTWGVPYRSDYIGRDANLGIVQMSGGYGVATYGRNSDYQNNPANYKVTTGYGTFQLCDSDSGALASYCEGNYTEVLRAVSNASVIGHEVDMGNIYGPPPGSNSYSTNPRGSATGVDVSTAISDAAKLVYSNNAAFLMNAPVGAYYQALLVQNGGVYGTNNRDTCVMDVTTTNGSSVATVTSLTCDDGVSTLRLGMLTNSATFGGSSIVLATARDTSPPQIKMSTNANATGTVSITFGNLEGEAIQLSSGSVGHAIRWDNPNQGKAAFLRGDFTGTQTGLGQIFRSTGVDFVAATGFANGTEPALASVLTSGMLSARGVASVGTAPTLSGTCSTATQAGGATAGKFNTSGVCNIGGTFILTFSVTATTGWACDMHDLTAPTAIIDETATTTTTATFTVRNAGTGGSDLINFKCTAY